MVLRFFQRQKPTRKWCIENLKYTLYVSFILNYILFANNENFDMFSGSHGSCGFLVVVPVSVQGKQELRKPQENHGNLGTIDKNKNHDTTGTMTTARTKRTKSIDENNDSP